MSTKLRLAKRLEELRYKAYLYSSKQTEATCLRALDEARVVVRKLEKKEGD